MFYPSNDQKEILDYVISQLNQNKLIHADVIAPAGSGKSTTIMYLLDYLNIYYSTLYLVFNTDMKKELEQRLSFNTSIFNIVNKENVSAYTFHGYLRKILSEKLPDIGFDYKNGTISQSQIKQLLTLNELQNNEPQLSYDLLAESFNNYITPFVKSTISLEEFLQTEENNPSFGIKEFNALLPLICKKNNIAPSTVNNFTRKEKTEIVKEIYNELLDDIFEKGLINDNLPHDIYYKYVHYKYENLDLFSDYPFVMVDEAQDIDPIIVSLIERSKSNIIMFGDNFQQINRFRGTINSLGNKKNKQFSLKYSYRLSPYLAFLTEGFLRQEAPKMNYNGNDVPQIFGVANNNLSIKESYFSVGDHSNFFSNIINELSTIDVTRSERYLEIKSRQKDIENSIRDKEKTNFKKAVGSFLKTKDNLQFYKDICKFSSYFDYLTEDEKEKNIISLEENEKDNDLLKNIYMVAKDFSFKLSKKDKKELLITESGSFGYLARNNKKVIGAFYDFAKTIPNGKLGEIPVYNIRLSLALEDMFDSFSKHKFNNIAPKNKAIMINSLKQIPSVMDNRISVWDVYTKLGNIEIPDKILAKLIENRESADKLIDIKIGKALRLKDFGAEGNDIKTIIDRGIKLVKTKTKDEIANVSINDFKSVSGLNKLNKLIPFEKFLSSQLDIKTVASQNSFNLLTNFYKYSIGKNIIQSNPNATLVNDGAFYNIYFSTGHKVKGLELDNVFIGNDIYDIDNKEDLEEKRDELKLAYVALTRTKKKLTLEDDSPLIEVLNSVRDNDFCRYYESKNFLVKEGLSFDKTFPHPYYSIKHRDERRIAVTDSVILRPQDSHLNSYNNSVVSYDIEKGEANILDKKNPFSNIDFEFIKPISEDMYFSKLDSYNQEMKEVIENAPF